MSGYDFDDFESEVNEIKSLVKEINNAEKSKGESKLIKDSNTDVCDNETWNRPWAMLNCFRNYTHFKGEAFTEENIKRTKYPKAQKNDVEELCSKIWQEQEKEMKSEKDSLIRSSLLVDLLEEYLEARRRALFFLVESCSSDKELNFLKSQPYEAFRNIKDNSTAVKLVDFYVNNFLNK